MIASALTNQRPVDGTPIMTRALDPEVIDAIWEASSRRSRRLTRPTRWAATTRGSRTGCVSGACEHKRVERVMAANGIEGVHKPAEVRTTIPAETSPTLPDLIGRLTAD